MIVVDNREIPSEILQLLDQMNLPHEEKQLEVADYQIYGYPIEVIGPNGDVVLYVIEHKGEDYIPSLTSGHLNDQLIRMSQVTKHSALVLVGSLNRMIEKSNVNRLSVYSSIAGTFLRHAKDGEQGSISLIMLETLQDLALLLQCIQKKLNDEGGLIRQPELTTPMNSGKKNNLVRSLMCCTGVGEEKARALLNYFVSLDIISQATPEKLQEVPGIGPKLAMDIYSHFHGLYIEEEQ